MNQTYGTLILGGDGRNAESLGLVVAWLISNRLISDYLERSRSDAIARVRMHDLTGPAFLTTILDGELKAEHLNAEGRRFAEEFLLDGRFQAIYDEANFVGDNEWARYATIAPKITSAWRPEPKPRPKPTTTSARILQFPNRNRK